MGVLVGVAGPTMPQRVGNATFVDIFIQSPCSAFVITVTKTDFLGHKNDHNA